MHPCTWHTPLFVCLGALLGSASVAAWRLKAAGRLNTVRFGAMPGAHPHHVVCQVVAAAILCMAFRRRLVSLKHAGDVKRAMRPTCRWTAGGWAERESKAMPWQPVASRPARSQTATEVAHERRHVYIFFLSPSWRLPSPNGCGFGEDSAKRTGNRLFCSNTTVPA